MNTPHRPASMASAAAALLVATFAGCHSLPALRYYSLAAVSPKAASHAAAPLLIRVRHVSVPHEMDHLGLTHYTGPTQLAISDNDRWTAPLNALIQATITRDLGERFGYEQVLAVDASPVAAQASLDLDFVALTADANCGIAAQVNWTLSSPGVAVRRGTAHLAAPATGCPAGLPTALSAALGDLADQLAQQLTAS